MDEEKEPTVVNVHRLIWNRSLGIFLIAMGFKYGDGDWWTVAAILLGYEQETWEEG